MKIKRYLATAALGLALLYSTGAGAADTLLAQTDVELAAGETAMAELWGDCLPNGYASGLLLMLKDADGKLLTAYNPSIKGGYNCQLQSVRVLGGKSRAQQLLVSAGQGDWRAASEYRILSFANKKKVREVFGAAEAMGLITQGYVKAGRLHVTMLDGSHSELAPAAGSEVTDGKLEFGPLYSLVAHDVDNDGRDELFSSQQLSQKKEPLADVGAVWQFDKKTKKWQQFSPTIMTLSPVPRENTINDGVDFAGGTVLVRKMVVPGGEATFPVFASRDVKLQNKINELLNKESSEYLKAFYQGSADMAFNVMRADSVLLSLQLISGKDRFIHHHVNIDPKTGELMRIDELLNTKDKDLLPLLNVLNTNKNVVYKDKLPDEWYMEGDNLFLLQRIDGVDQVSGFAIGNLHKFLLKKNFLPQKAD